jgi:opacity protein-like surface antigen
LAVVGLALLSAQPSAFAAEAPVAWLDEVRAGGASLIDYGKNGYVQFEALFSPLPSAAAYDPNWAWLLSPRPLVGAKVSLQGKTNEVFAGIAWNLPVASPFIVEMSVGALVHDQTLFQDYSDRPILTNRFLFRESIAIGYEINRDWRILAFADHASNGNLGQRNLSVNRIGIMLGAKLGRSTNSPPTPFPISMFSWAGPIAGLSAGLVLGEYEFVIHEPQVASEQTRGIDPSVSLGGHLGYNWVFGSIVAGVEGDLSRQGTSFPASRFGPIQEEISASAFWMATARVRVGVDVEPAFLIDRILLYATGGAAFAKVARSYCNPPASQYHCYVNGEVGGGWLTEQGIHSGWTAGAGYEIPLAAGIAFRLEYPYASFGRISFANGPIVNDVSFSEHLLRAGFSIGFSGP